MATVSGPAPRAPQRRWLFRTKNVEQSIADTDEPQHRLRRALGPVDLVVFGVGVIVGTGIFVLTGKAAGTLAGPAISLSFVAAAIACGLAALCYAEFASTVPVAGSAYTFSYASLGELIAWIIGWDLILELALGAATVASGWSTYFRVVLEGAPFHLALPAWVDASSHNIVAAAIVLVLTAVLCFGIRLSSRVNLVIVVIKVAIVLLVIFAGIAYIKSRNYDPFIPPSGSRPAPGGQSETSLLQDLGFTTGTFGVGGIFTGAALVFFAFIGFDIVATAAEETKRPQRDLPIGIFGSLAICTVLYVAVSLVVTGMVKYTQIKVDAPLANAFISVGQRGIGTIVSYGALAGLTTVMLILMLGQSRVFFAMSATASCRPPSPRYPSASRRPTARRSRRGRGRGARGVRAPDHARRPGQHRHPVRVRRGVDRSCRPASQPARPAPVVPHSGGAADTDPLGARVGLPHAQPPRRHLAALRNLDGGGTGDLRPLRRAPQPPRPWSERRQRGRCGRRSARLREGFAAVGASTHTKTTTAPARAPHFDCQKASSPPAGAATTLRHPSGPSRGSRSTEAPSPRARLVAAKTSATAT